MVDSAFGPGKIISVRRFNDPAPLEVVVKSSDNVGSGATARIFKGRAGPRGHRYEVALKVIPDLLDREKQYVLEYLISREVDAISRLSELQMCRILPFIGVASVQFQMVIVSAFMRNGNLLQYFRTKPDADRQRLVIQVAEGVHWLHEFAKLVHGDLKCENVLVNDDGDAVIADFGLSTLVEQETSDSTTISAIRGMSTLRFAAPELVFAPERAMSDERPRSKTRESDVYAFGMLILQAFSGMRPWPNLRDVAIVGRLENQITHPRPDDNVTMVGLTNSWWAVCLRCWEREPHARPTMDWVWVTLEEKRRKPRTLIAIEELFCIALSPCGKRVVSGSQDGSVAIWDSETGEAVCSRLLGHTGRVRQIAVSPDGHQICSCSEDQTIRRWDAESGATLGNPMTGHDDAVYCVAVSPDGTRIVTGANDKTVRLWDSVTGEAAVDPLAGHTGGVLSVAFSPDGAAIASGSHDDTIRLWSSATGACSGILQYDATVLSVCFSPDRIHLVSGDSRGTVRIWNTSTRQLVRKLMGHSGVVKSIVVSPSGRYIASASTKVFGSTNGTICIWDAHTGDAVGMPLAGRTSEVYTVAFSPDGSSLVSGSRDGTIRIWNFFD